MDGTHQLRAQLESFWPGAAKIFNELDSPIALAFLRHFPSPADAQGLSEEGLASLLAKNSSRARRTPAELLERLRSAPESTLGNAETAARRRAVLGLVSKL